MDEKTAKTAEIALQKLNQLIGDDEMIVFNKSEAAALREVATVWMQFRATIALGATIGGAVKWLVLILAAWAAFKAGLFTWLREGMD